jgi:arsenate reductase-like glutaredoxin family protein
VVHRSRELVGGIRRREVLRFVTDHGTAYEAVLYVNDRPEREALEEALDKIGAAEEERNEFWTAYTKKKGEHDEKIST